MRGTSGLSCAHQSPAAEPQRQHGELTLHQQRGAGHVLLSLRCTIHSRNGVFAGWVACKENPRRVSTPARAREPRTTVLEQQEALLVGYGLGAPTSRCCCRRRHHRHRCLLNAACSPRTNRVQL